MSYRRKIILGLIELLGGEVEKLLFLYSEKKPQAEYDFIPYKYGCYSYSAKADIHTMVRKGYLSETENKYSKEDRSNYYQKLKKQKQKKYIKNELKNSTVNYEKLGNDL